jgi:hypothetical protein
VDFSPVENDPEAMLRLAKRHPDRIIPTVRLSGKPYGESRSSLFSKWDKDMAGGVD